MTEHEAPALLAGTLDLVVLRTRQELDRLMFAIQQVLVTSPWAT